MTRTILFVQGAGEGAHDRWDARLVESLERALGEGYAIRYPRMPDEAAPSHARWQAALRRELDALEDGAIVVAHSAGATSLVHVLAEALPAARLGGLFLIAAPFLGEGGWPSDDGEARAALPGRLAPALPVFLFHGTADGTVPVAHVELYARAIPHATVRTLAGRDHQLGNDLREIADEIRRLPEHG